jgi:AraC family transcriptional activator of pobA
MGDREQGSVPRFQLYGERPGPADVDFVHVESIESRSAPLGWRIDDHTHAGLAQLLVVAEGAIEASLDRRPVTVGCPAALTLPVGVIHSFDFRPGTVGHVVTFASAWLDGTVGSQEARLFTAPRVVDLAAHPMAAARLCALLDHLADECAAHDDARVRAWLVQTALAMVARCLPPDADGSVRAESDFGLVRELRDVIEAHLSRRLTTADFARLLNVSVSTLDRACRSVAACSAHELVQRRLELEARRQLAYRSTSVARIAADLGFDDAAYFSRFFRRRVGVSPIAFRRSLPRA